MALGCLYCRFWKQLHRFLRSPRTENDWGFCEKQHNQLTKGSWYGCTVGKKIIYLHNIGTRR